MAAKHPAEQVRGRTIRFSWTEGPTKGTTHEHVFHEDGTVEWHAVSNEKNKPAATEADRNRTQPERPRYSSVEVTDDFWLVSYLASSGYTLTVVLNYEDGSMVGIASNEKNWFPLRGRFHVVD
jgi:hypothetical protein